MPTKWHIPLWPSRSIKPPYGSVEIDWAHPLANGLLAWFSPHVDLVSGITLSGSGGAGLGGFSGRPELGIIANTANARFAMTALDRHKVNPPITFACRMRVSAVTSINIGFCGITANNANISPYQAFSFGTRAGNEFVIAYSNGTTGFLQAIAGAYDFDTLAYPWNAHCVGVIPSGANATLRVNGASVTLTTPGTVTAFTYSATSQLFVGEAWTNQNRNPQANLTDFQIWNRALSVDEQVALYADPYCFLRPVKRRSYGFVGGAPMWEQYTGPIDRAWRYIQWKLEYDGS